MENQQQSNSYPPPYNDDEITLKDLILKVRGYFLECKRRWRIIVSCILIALIVQWIRIYLSPIFYPAVFTFMVNDTKGPSIGGLLGQLGGLVGDKEEKLETIIELAKTRRMMSGALLEKGSVNGKVDFYANHLIQFQGYHYLWRKDTILKDFLFSHSNVDSFSNRENNALKSIHVLIVGGEKIKEPLYSASVNKKSGILTFSIKTFNEELSLKLCNAIFKSLSNFYVESSTRKEQETFDILSAKKDSIERILFRNDISSAKHDDQNNSLISNVDKVPAKRYARENLVLSSLYAEVIKNTEMAEFALKASTPYVNAVDEPILPLKPIKLRFLVSSAIGGIVGLVLGVLIVLGYKKYREMFE